MAFPGEVEGAIARIRGDEALPGPRLPSQGADQVAPGAEDQPAGHSPDHAEVHAGGEVREDLSDERDLGPGVVREVALVLAEDGVERGPQPEPEHRRDQLPALPELETAHERGEETILLLGVAGAGAEEPDRGRRIGEVAELRLCRLQLLELPQGLEGLGGPLEARPKSLPFRVHVTPAFRPASLRS